MHGNTYTSPNGYKTRNFEDVMEEIQGYFAVHREEGSWPGGIHIELTGDNVTECLGGSDEVSIRPSRGTLRDDVRSPSERPPVARPRLPGGRALEELRTAWLQTTSRRAGRLEGDFGPNVGLVEEIYRQWLEDPASVAEGWQDFFADYKPRPAGGNGAACWLPSGSTAPAAAEDAAPAEAAARRSCDSGRSGAGEAAPAELRPGKGAPGRSCRPKLRSGRAARSG